MAAVTVLVMLPISSAPYSPITLLRREVLSWDSRAMALPRPPARSALTGSMPSWGSPAGVGGRVKTGFGFPSSLPDHFPAAWVSAAPHREGRVVNPGVRHSRPLAVRMTTRTESEGGRVAMKVATDRSATWRKSGSRTGISTKVHFWPSLPSSAGVRMAMTSAVLPATWTFQSAGFRPSAMPRASRGSTLRVRGSAPARPRQSRGEARQRQSAVVRIRFSFGGFAQKLSKGPGTPAREDFRPSAVFLPVPSRGHGQGVPAPLAPGSHVEGRAAQSGDLQGEQGVACGDAAAAVDHQAAPGGVPQQVRVHAP